jgi:nicotinate-nucleotide adenylyltransferase
MARLAFAGMADTIVSPAEVHSSQACYTIDTINALSREYPGSELYLLIGTDMYFTLDTWKDAADLLRTVTPAVFARDEGDPELVSAFAKQLEATYGASTVVITGGITDISSSRLRGMLPEREGAGYIIDATYSYIVKRRLYAAKPDWDWLRAKANGMLAPSRVAHVAGCESEALRLAKRWGANADDAREAALLHDITKILDADGHMALLDRYGSDELRPPPDEEKLLHSKTGALVAREEFGVSDEVAGAILWHTTGRANMTLLEKVIYLTDYIEPTREIEGLEELKLLAYKDIDAAMCLGLEMSIRDMRERGITPNNVTFDALEDIRNGITEK